MNPEDTIFISIIGIFSTLIVAVLAAVMYFKAPAYKNALFGYRTPRAFKNEESWFFAQRFSGKWLFITTATLTIVRLYFFFFEPYSAFFDLFLYFALFFFLIIIVAVTEIKLKKMQS